MCMYVYIYIYSRLKTLGGVQNCMLEPLARAHTHTLSHSQLCLCKVHDLTARVFNPQVIV